MERLSAEEARTVELSLNPIKRLGQLAEYGAAFHTRLSGYGGISGKFVTRGELVRMAEAHEKVEDLDRLIEQVSNRNLGEE